MRSIFYNIIRYKYLMLAIIILGFITTGCISRFRHKYSALPISEISPKIDGLPTSGKYRGVVIDDLDNDQNPDIAGCASSPGTVAVWYGDGKGNIPDTRFLPVKGDVRSIAVGNFNADKLKDIVFSVQKEATGIQVWLQQPGRQWIKGISPVEGNSYEGVRAVDINKDGYTDIIAANVTADAHGGIQVWISDGSGSWPVESGPTVNGIFMDVAAADFDKDGNIDIVGSGWGTYGLLKIWLGDGAGGWSAMPALDSGSFYGLSTADINNDGNIDILAGTYRRGIQIFLGQGNGQFYHYIQPVESGSFWNVLCADPDADGIKEILASSLDSKGIKVWRNLAISTNDYRQLNVSWESLSGLFPTDGIYYTITVGDLNKDGLDDIGAANFGEGIKLWLNKWKTDNASKHQRITTSVDSDIRTNIEATDENTVFTMNNGVPEYKIGPGDLLEITMWKRSTGTKEEILVRPDGKISFAFVEDLFVSGLTPTQLDAVLTKDLEKYIKDPRIDVIVKKYQSKFATFAGEIYMNVTFRSGPGQYELTGRISILEMLSKIGGPTPNANLRDVRIRKKNGSSFSVDLYKTINFGDKSQDVVLDDGDLIIIPAITREANRVYVFGEVERPGVYTFTGTDMRLFDAVAQAGGITVFSIPESTKVVRGDITRPEVLSADLKKLIETGDRTQDVALENGDLVYVPRSFVGDVNVFVKQISPLLSLIFTPARFRDEYLTEEAWHLP